MKIKKYIKYGASFAAPIFLLSSVIGIGGASAGPYIPTSYETGLSDRDIEDVLIGILRWLLGIVGIIAMIGFAVSGTMYLISAGNDKMAESAKKGITASIIGIAVALSAYIIVRAIDLALRGMPQ